ncbi:MAG: acyltransferase [Bacteroidales bacterium]|nr:acyltransferase [Bacteroidales bacterium]
MKKERIVFIDYLRWVACFMVILVHSSENFYGADSSGLAGNVSMLANEGNRFWVAFFDGGCARVAVPLFMIVSAFLLVPMSSGMSMTTFYKKRFMRILPPMIIFMIIYSFLPLLWNGMTIEQSINDFKMLPFNFPSMAGHLWFMYPLISIYLIIPIISPWLEKATKKDELIFIGIFAFTTIIPFLHRFVSPELWGECFWNQFSAFWYFSGYIGYLVLAHYIRVHLNWSYNKKLIVGAISFLAGASFTTWSFWWKGVPGVTIETPALEWAWEFCTLNVLCATFGIFLLFTCIKKNKTPRIVAEIADLSFGIYLMHLLYLGPIAKWIINGDVTNPLVPIYFAIPLIAVLTFICCLATSKVLSYIPGSQYVIGYHNDLAKLYSPGLSTSESNKAN